MVKVVGKHYPGNAPTTELALLTASQKPATRCSSELIRCLTGTLVLGLGLGSTTFSRWLWFTCLSTCLACCVVDLSVLCRPELVRMDVAGCSTALGRRSVAGILVAARLSACAHSVGLPRPSPSFCAYRSVGRNKKTSVSTEPSAFKKL